MAITETDDFILTISSDDEIDDHDIEDEPSFTALAQPAEVNGRKRKGVFNGGKHGSTRPAKIGRNSKSNSKETYNNESEEQEKNDSALESDGSAMNSDFEFGISREAFDNDDIEDVWSSKIGARAVGVDAIINRRRNQQREVDAAESTNQQSSVGAEEENGLLTLDDADERLGKDGFGMGNVPDSFEVDDKEQDSFSESSDHGSETLEQSSVRPGAKNGVHHDDSDQQDEDEDDFAAPMPHPDDASDDGNSTDDEMRKRQAAFFEPQQPVSSTTTNSLGSNTFQSMSLSRPILKGVSTAGFNSPTAIQEKAIPVALLGKDVVGGAVTGSGKTAAFVIPILERLLYRPKKVPTTRVAILMPTRELAVQCHNVGTKLASFTDISFALLVGGLSLREQEQALKKRPDIVIATPGRFIDHMRNSASFAVENIEILVLDEADRMLEDGFADELNEVLAAIPKSRQTMLFSATMTENVDQLIRAGLQRPVRLIVDQKKQTVQGLTQEFIKMKAGKGDIDEERRLAYLLQVCSSVYTTKTIVFFPRKSLAHRVKVLFALQGIEAAELHGSMSQEQRLASISSFREGQATHLLATDLASRGLDIPRVETVINFTVPTTPTTYLHRVGRTARAGQKGVSCTLFSPLSDGKKSKTSSERALLRPVIRLAKNQGANIRARKIPQDVVNDLEEKVSSLQEEIDSILKEEKEERLLQQTERDLTKGENIVKYQEEIASRPRRTWFQSEKEKKAASKLGRQEPTAAANARSTNKPLKQEKRKLSGKDKKRLQDRDMRSGGQNKSWKKSKSSNRKKS